jgi:hypothetical protein
MGFLHFFSVHWFSSDGELHGRMRCHLVVCDYAIRRIFRGSSDLVNQPHLVQSLVREIREAPKYRENMCRVGDSGPILIHRDNLGTGRLLISECLGSRLLLQGAEPHKNGMNLERTSNPLHQRLTPSTTHYIKDPLHQGPIKDPRQLQLLHFQSFAILWGIRRNDNSRLAVRTVANKTISTRYAKAQSIHSPAQPNNTGSTYNIASRYMKSLSLQPTRQYQKYPRKKISHTCKVITVTPDIFKSTQAEKR